MKRPTIASLQKQIAELDTKLSAALSSNSSLNDARRAAQSRIGELENQARNRESDHASELCRAGERVIETETTLHRHRAAVLVYFMACANPETAKDGIRLAVLQHEVTSTVASPAPSPASQCMPELLRSPRRY